MGYFLLVISFICNVFKGFFGKKTSTHVNGLRDGIVLNVSRMAVCAIIGLIMTLITDGNLLSLKIPSNILLITFVSGFSIALFVIFWVFAAQKGAFMLLDVFISIGLIVPVFLTHFMYGEEISYFQYLGIAILLVASFFMCSYSNKSHHKLDLIEVLLLIGICLANGFFLFAQKWFAHENVTSITSSVYNLYTYLFATIIFLIVYVFIAIKDKVTKRKLPRSDAWILKIHPIVIGLAFFFFFYSYVLTIAAAYFDAVILYPVVQGVCLILNTLMSAIALKEKPNAKSIVAIALTIGAILIINLL